MTITVIDLGEPILLWHLCGPQPFTGHILQCNECKKKEANEWCGQWFSTYHGRSHEPIIYEIEIEEKQVDENGH